MPPGLNHFLHLPEKLFLPICIPIVVKNLLFGKWMNLLIVWNCSGALGKLTPLKREDPISLRNNGMHSLVCLDIFGLIF